MQFEYAGFRFVLDDENWVDVRVARPAQPPAEVFEYEDPFNIGWGFILREGQEFEAACIEWVDNPVDTDA